MSTRSKPRRLQGIGIETHLLGSLGLLSSCGSLGSRGSSVLGGGGLGLLSRGSGLGLGRSPQGLWFCQYTKFLGCLVWYREAYEVVAEELHDKRRVLVAFLAESVELCEGRN